MKESFKRWAEENGFSLNIPFPPVREPHRLIELGNFGFARVDEIIYPLLSQFTWFAQDGGKGRWYVARREREHTGRYKTFYMHSEITKRYVEIVPCRFKWPLPCDVIVEFKNNIGLDCMIRNLKLVTKREHIDLLALRNSGSKR